MSVWLVPPCFAVFWYHIFQLCMKRAQFFFFIDDRSLIKINTTVSVSVFLRHRQHTFHYISPLFHCFSHLIPYHLFQPLHMNLLIPKSKYSTEENDRIIRVFNSMLIIHLNIIKYMMQWNWFDSYKFLIIVMLKSWKIILLLTLIRHAPCVEPHAHEGLCDFKPWQQWIYQLKKVD